MFPLKCEGLIMAAMLCCHDALLPTEKRVLRSLDLSLYQVDIMLGQVFFEY